MFPPSEYQLLDFGDERKLERIGRYVLDRPSPAAAGQTRALRDQQWEAADAAFWREEGSNGRWTRAWPNDASWELKHPLFRLEIKPTPVGHLGVFPEHAECWDWIVEKTRSRSQPLRLLNLFAYTGAASLAAAKAGAEVVHIDSAKNVVAWARRNAERSGLSEAPIRWITEDATRFVEREARRGNRYDAIIADPPTYGHGPKGEVWQIDQSLPTLLHACGSLLVEDPVFVLLSCHSPGYDGPFLTRLLREARLIASENHVEHGATQLQCADRRSLTSGAFARWSSA